MGDYLDGLELPQEQFHSRPWFLFSASNWTHGIYLILLTVLMLQNHHKINDFLSPSQRFCFAFFRSSTTHYIDVWKRGLIEPGAKVQWMG